VTDAPPPLSQEQRTALLEIARRTIRERVRGVQTSGAASNDPTLQVAGAAFVTITCDGQLRGCIGYVDPIKPLAEAVAHCAASAATADPRFLPITPEELPRLRVEVSVLSPLRVVSDPRAIRVGTHGLFISHEGRHGLLLPQVARKFAWDRDTFLRQTCLKAGLPGDAWKRGAEIRVFTVDHFADDGPVETQTP
jgi:AmmeMemoRadiSam system protein A